MGQDVKCRVRTCDHKEVARDKELARAMRYRTTLKFFISQFHAVHHRWVIEFRALFRLKECYLNGSQWISFSGLPQPTLKPDVVGPCLLSRYRISWVVIFRREVGLVLNK